MLSHQERVDPPGLAYERDVRRHVLRERFQEGDVRRACQMPVLRIADDEVQDVLPGGEHDHRRVTDLGGEPMDPILPLLRDRHPEERLVVLLLRRGPGRERREEKRR